MLNRSRACEGRDAPGAGAAGLGVVGAELSHGRAEGDSAQVKAEMAFPIYPVPALTIRSEGVRTLRLEIKSCQRQFRI